MKRVHPFVIVAAVVAVCVLPENASAMYHPELGQFIQRDPGAGSALRARGKDAAASTERFIPRDQYADGMDLYQYVQGRPTCSGDPLGLYNDDVHYDETYTSALAAGFSERSAERLARADVGQDTEVAPDRRAPQLRLHIGNARDWSTSDCFWSNCFFWDNAVAELWHLPRVGGAEGRVHANSDQSRVLLDAAISGQSQLSMSDYISFRLECGHVNTDIHAKSGTGMAYHLEIEQTLFGGRRIAVTNVRDALDTFGQGLHAYQDSYAHQGGLTGHGWRTMPDPDKNGVHHFSCPLNGAADIAAWDKQSHADAMSGTVDLMRRFLTRHPEYK